MDLTVARKYLLKEIVDKLSQSDPLDTDDIDCTDLACTFIFDDLGRTYYNNETLLYSINNLLPNDIEFLKKLRREYPQKVTHNKNTGQRRSINNATTYLNKLRDEEEDVGDEGEDNDHRSHDIITISAIGELCHKIAWLCFTMGYSRSMIQRINFSVLRDNYRNVEDFQQIIVTSQTILIM